MGQAALAQARGDAELPKGDRLGPRPRLLGPRLRFEPTEYDWRVGVLDGQPLYACRYFMAPAHWQVVKRDKNGAKREGDHETLDVKDVPKQVLNVAVQAARAIGSGLYGVDLKQFGGAVKVIEVNDNPNIDYGVEDLVLKDQIYRSVMEYFVRRLDAHTRLKQER